jgi:predicted metal-dependent HD superfamily phosphohydrolase
LVAGDSALSSWLSSLPTDWTSGCDQACFERAWSSYNSPGRRYHTWQHVLTCVTHLKTFSLGQPRIAFLALVFHDAVYVPGRSDNEEQSASLARAALATQRSISVADLAAIERMILATKDHHAHAQMATADEATVLDIDLSILGAPRANYAWYAQAIHDEYVPAATTDPEFRVGRMSFLQRMLGLRDVYLTPEGRARWNEPARMNMTWEIEALEPRTSRER